MGLGPGPIVIAWGERGFAADTGVGTMAIAAGGVVRRGGGCGAGTAVVCGCGWLVIGTGVAAFWGSGGALVCTGAGLKVGWERTAAAV